MKKILFVSLILLITLNIYGGQEKAVNYKELKKFVSSDQNGNWIINSSAMLEIKDNKFNQITLQNNGFEDKDTYGAVILKIDHSISANSTFYKAIVEFDVNYKQKDIYGNLINVQTTKTLEVINDVSNHSQTDFSLFNIDGAYSIEVIVNSLQLKDIDNNNILTSFNSFPENIKVEISQQTERNYDFVSSLPRLTHFKDIDLDGINTTIEEIEIYWNFLPGDEKYELEWTFINNYEGLDNSNNITYIQNNSELKYNFKNNSTKVLINENYYRIPLIFEHGYLIYRVRPVGNDQNFEYSDYLDWSLSETGDVANLINLSSGYYYNYIIHERDKNWQYISTYAEEGKNKVVVNYMDGTNRSRQKVTQSNTDKEAIVGETIYDFIGRPAIEVLPVPTGSQTLKYYSNFNLDNSTQPNIYSWKNFDLQQGNNCNTSTEQMYDLSGASRYYSSASLNQVLHQNALPNANNYPFMQTEYEPDNAGKVSRKGGVGEKFQLNSTGKYTKYFYGQPLQNDLDKLFGSEVGYAEHYQKNIVVDPNGQSSVSYIDMFGKTIATSLIGNKPSNLVELPGYQLTPVTIAEDVLLNANHISYDNNEVVCEKDILIPADNSILVINYTLTGEKYEDPCMEGFCFDCEYILSIKLIDKNCGDVKYTNEIDFPNLVLDYNCQTPLSKYEPGSVTLNNLDAGKYTLRKVLKVRDDFANNYADKYISLPECNPTAQIPDVDISGCCFDCDDCKSLISSFASYSTLYISKNPDASTEEIQSNYNLEVKKCKLLCQETSPCEMAFPAMLSDVSKGGQYGGYMNKETGEVNPSLYPLSVFNEANKINGFFINDANWRHPSKIDPTSPGVLIPTDYVDENGSIVLIDYISNGFNVLQTNIDNYAEIINGISLIKPQYLSDVKDFISIWQPSFAQALVVFHPEYAYYEWCIKNDVENYPFPFNNSQSNAISSNDFDRILMDKNNDIGFYSSIIGSNNYDKYTILAADPFFNNLGLGLKDINDNEISSGIGMSILYHYLNCTLPNWTGKDLMEKLMETYVRVKPTDPDEQYKLFDIAEAAYMSSSACPPEFYSSVLPSLGCIPLNKSFTQLVNVENFRDFFGFYLLCKKRVQEIYADFYSLHYYSRINSVFPPFSWKPKGIYTPFWYKDETFSPFFWNSNNYHHSKKYNSLNIEVLIPKGITSNGTPYNDGLLPFNDEDIDDCTDGISLHEFGARQPNFSSIFSYTSLPKTPPLFFMLDKVKRFPKINDSYGTIQNEYDVDDEDDDGSGSEETQLKIKNNLDYYRYATTGQCPFAYDLEVILNSLLFSDPTDIKNIFPVLSQNWIKIQGLSKSLYDAFGGSNIQTETFKWQATTITNSSFTGKVSGTLNEKAIIVLNDATASNIWNKIISFRNFRTSNYDLSTSINNFTVTARYIDNGVKYDILLTGNIDVTGNAHKNICCTEDDFKECKPNCETKALQSVFNYVLNKYLYLKSTTSLGSGQFFNIETNIKIAWSESCLKNLFFADDLASSDLEAKVTENPNNTIEITIKNNQNNAEISIYLNENITNFATGGTFSNIIPVNSQYNNANSFEISYKPALTNFSVFTLTGSIEYKMNNGVPVIFNTGLCETLPNLSCKTPEHINKKELINFLNKLIQPNTNNSPNLFITTNSFNLLPGNLISNKLWNILGNPDNIIYNASINSSNTTLNAILSTNVVVSGITTNTELCKFTLNIDDTDPNAPTSLNFNTISNFDFENLDPIAENNTDYSYNFVLNATTSSSSVVLLKGNSTLLLSDCIVNPPCDPNKNPVASQFTTIVKNINFNDHNAFNTSYNPYNSNIYMDDVDQQISSGSFTLTKIDSYNSTPPNEIKDNDQPGVGRFFASALEGGNPLTIEVKDVKLKAGKFYKFAFLYQADEGSYDIDILKGGTNTIYNSNTDPTYCINPFDLSTYSGVNLTNPTVNWLDFNSSNASIYKALISETTTITFRFKSTFDDQKKWFSLDNIRILEADGCTQDIVEVDEPDFEDDSCQQIMMNIHANNLYVLNEQQNKVKREQFISNYKSKCVTAIENLNISLTTAAEHHYTLYYYDQAGNLVKTIPPKGVDLSYINTQSPYTNAKVDRIAGNVVAAHNPAHTMATSYAYNSLNQLIYQITPDGGLTEFWYDDLGRIIISQNAKQSDYTKYSYTIYDALGRIEEVGEIDKTTGDNNAVLNSVNHYIPYLDFYNPIGTNYWLSSGTRKEITHTFYDEPMTGFINPYSNSIFNQDNLMKRVSSSAYYTDYTNLLSNYYQFASHYSYDIHGNVKSIVQDYPAMGNFKYKLINYEYDLVSGKVNKVIFQPKAADQFMHRYEYDADNRLTHVFTSRNGIIWEKEAKYWYYKHGPLARTEIGDLDVQGMDYAYTLQGWVKGINSNILEAGNDLGRDNYNDAQNLHKNFGEDVASYSIGYFSGDYTAINQNYANFVAGIGSADLASNAPDLYNGNINHMVTTIRDMSSSVLAAKPQLTGYRYDQLNRIRQMKTQNAISSNNWAGSWVDKYKTLYDYDANGNIESLARYDNSQTPQLLDDMHYHYTWGNNTLDYITDPEHPTPDDIEGQLAGNYKYDQIGNLIVDISGKIRDIKWNVYGKIESIIRPDGNTTDDWLYFEYDAQGNRIYKKAWKKDASGQDLTATYTYYVRDAQGNILAIYTQDGTNEMKLSEFELYGSSRLGTAEYKTDMSSLSLQQNGIYSRTLGLKRYEVTNHLGNVLSVFNDKKYQITSTTRTSPYLISTFDYYPFGMIMNGRSDGGDKYRFGFNGKEKDDEVSGTGNQYDYGFRIYNPRIGKFLSVDPLTKSFPMLTPYQFSSNTPISCIDLDGLEAKLAIYGAGIHRDNQGNISQKNHENQFRIESNYQVQLKNATQSLAIHDGSALIKQLEESTKEEGSIQFLFISSHASNHGLILDNGQYGLSYVGYKSSITNSQGQDYNITSFNESILNNENIKFSNDALVVFAGCNAGKYSVSIAAQMTKKLGVATIGADGYTQPTDKTDRKADYTYNLYYKDENGDFQTMSLGNKLNKKSIQMAKDKIAEVNKKIDEKNANDAKQTPTDN